MPQKPQTARRAVERARRLADLDAVLGKCRTLLQRAEGGDKVIMLLERIERAQREVDRLRGLGTSRPVEPATQQALTRQLAHWTENVREPIAQEPGGLK